MQIWVTRDDIENGVRAAGNNCPIARAVKRTIPEARTVWVATMITAVTKDGVCLVDQDLTQEQANFVAAFDKGRAVDPILIEVEMI